MQGLALEPGPAGPKKIVRLLTHVSPQGRMTAMTNETPVTDKSAKARVRLNVSLSAETHKRLKVYCAQRNVAIKDQVAAMLDKAFAARDGDAT